MNRILLKRVLLMIVAIVISLTVKSQVILLSPRSVDLIIILDKLFNGIELSTEISPPPNYTQQDEAELLVVRRPPHIPTGIDPTKVGVVASSAPQKTLVP